MIMSKASDIFPIKLVVIIIQENHYTQHKIAKKAKISEAPVCCRITRSLDSKRYQNSKVGKHRRKRKFTARTEEQLI